MGCPLALVSPAPEDSDLLRLGGRFILNGGTCSGLDGGEGHPPLDFAADVWWVVQPLKAGPVSICGSVQIQRFIVVFAGSPCDAVDHLARSSMHASAAVCGSTIYTDRQNGVASVGALGVAISRSGPACAGAGGVAFGLTSALAGDGGLAFAARGGGARAGDGGLARVVGDGVAQAGRGGVAIAGDGGTSVAEHAIVGEDGHARVDAWGGVFAAGRGSTVRVPGRVLRVGEDCDPDVAYQATATGPDEEDIERVPALDPIVARAVLGSRCDLTNDALTRYFLEHRPLGSDAVRKLGLNWLSAHRSCEVPTVPEAAEWYVLETRDYAQRILERHSAPNLRVVADAADTSLDPES